MKLDEFIEKLNDLKTKVGSDKDIVFVCADGENDVFTPDYPIVGDYEDSSGHEYKCAFMISMDGDEFTKKGMPHYSWKPSNDILK